MTLLPFASTDCAVHHARLRADGGGHLVNALGIEGRGQSDGLGKFRGSVGCHAVQRLAPPVVAGHAQPRNGARLVHQLAGLFFERHALHQVGRALLRRKTRVKIRGLSGFLRPQRARRAQPQQSSRHHSQSKHRHRLPARGRPVRAAGSTAQTLLPSGANFNARFAHVSTERVA